MRVLNDKIYYQLSGQAIDHCIANLTLRKNSKQNHNENSVDLTKQLSFAEFQRLIAEVQRAKENLSSNNTASIQMDSFVRDLPFNVSISR